MKASGQRLHDSWRSPVPHARDAAGVYLVGSLRRVLTERPQTTASTPPAPSTIATTSPIETSDVAAPATTETTAPAADASTTTPALTERTIDHAAGQTVVPAQPERIAVLSCGAILPVLLALGVGVAAAPLPEVEVPTELLIPDDLAGIDSIGFPSVNLEALAAIEPDLVIGFAGPGEDYDLLSNVAPTVLLDNNLDDWKAITRSIAHVVGLDAEADAAIAEWESDAQQLAVDLGDALASEVSVVRSFGEAFRIHTEYHFAGQIISEVGLARPADQLSSDPTIRKIDLSLEELPRIDADVLFLYGAGSLGSAGDGIGASLADLQASALWPTLSVATNDAVVIVDPLAWQQGGLPVAQIVFDNLRDALVSG